jgi:hypothetical protein
MFFWQGGATIRKYHLVKRNLIARPKEKGVLGLNDWETMNIYCLDKWWWKLENKEDLWKNIKS